MPGQSPPPPPLNADDQHPAQPPLAIDYHPANPVDAPPQNVTLATDGTVTTVALDALGPIVVNEDGTMSRIMNWDIMGEEERRNVVRVVGRRNQVRLARLRAAEEDGRTN
ncbi:hypothetical protein HDU67_004094 [Dinochytrium kinnereticum]|nr:hypothetical protein HDU67_004094 [Dinochytrium kinnereticum]